MTATFFSRLLAVEMNSADEGMHDRHFRTDHLLPNLKHRTVSSGFVTGISQASQFALMLGSTMVLARLLSPRDFGLVAMVWTVMGFLRVFKEAGLSTATVQREGITHAQVSNLFWVNLAVSGCITLLVAGAAPAIARFYKEPRLVGVTLFLSVSFFLTGVAVQHLALLNRQMRFKAIAVIQVGSTLSGIIVGITMAGLQCSYWSLVGMNLTTSFMALVMTWSVSGWRPQRFRRHSGTRSLVHFGTHLTAGTFFYSLARGLDGLLIGRFSGAPAVGLYNRASTLLNRPLEQAIAPVEAVFIPALSRIQGDEERYQRAFLQIYETIVLSGSLLTGTCLGLAHPITRVVLGPKWGGAAIIFASFTLAALQYFPTTFATWLFFTQGRGKGALAAASIMAVLVAGSFIAGVPYGPAGVAMSYSLSCLLLQMPILFWLAGRSGPVTTSDLWKGFLKYLPVWAIVCLVTWSVRIPIPDDQPLTELLIAGTCGILAGIACISVYPPARRLVMALLSLLAEMASAPRFAAWLPSRFRSLIFKMGSVKRD